LRMYSSTWAFESKWATCARTPFDSGKVSKV
jgi:hypothetical protein